MPNGLSHGFLSCCIVIASSPGWVLSMSDKGRTVLANVAILLVPHMSLSSVLPASGDTGAEGRDVIIRRLHSRRSDSSLKYSREE